MVDKFFDRELHCFYHKVASVGYTYCIVVWEEVGGELVTKGAGDVACNEASDCCWDTEGAEFGCVVGVLVETE